MIRTIRGVRVMLDRDLAKIYGVPTFRFNEAIKRNRHRFPEDFMFQLSRAEFDSLTSQIAMSSGKHAALTSQNAMSKTGRGGRRTLPYAFTEHGALQAANVLRSPRAVQMNTTCGDAVGWTALSVWETGERSGDRESTCLSSGLSLRCAKRFAALPNSHGNSLPWRKSSPPDWTCMRRQSCRSCARSCRSSIRRLHRPHRQSRTSGLGRNPPGCHAVVSRRQVTPKPWRRQLDILSPLRIPQS